MTPQESLRYNANHVYPAAGFNIMYTKDIAVSTTVLGTDCLILVDTSTVAVTVILPSQAYTGEQHQIVDNVGNASVRNITINGGLTLVGGPQLINGATNAVVATNFGSVTVRFNGTAWVILGKV